MKKIFLNFAKFNGEADGAVFSILDNLSNEDREKERGSYYGSLSGLFRHLMGGTVFLLGMFKSAVSGNGAALKALESLEGLAVPQDKLSDAQWKGLASILNAADKAFVDFVSALGEKDYDAPVPLNWYGGNPASVPLYFMLQQLVAHGTHHRGQISQILDELKIDNDYSGINVQFLA
jgi:uncharacterized damage-inducible protein DinB